MSEKFFALLLRLYPATFRARYGEESIQLYRDRLRDEIGPFAKLRLWLDLLTDLAISVPRAHRLQPAVPETSRPATAITLFGVLEEPTPRPAAFVLASALALAGLITFSLLLNYAGARIANARASSLQQKSAVPTKSHAAQNAPPVLGRHIDATPDAEPQTSIASGELSPQQQVAKNAAPTSPAALGSAQPAPLTPDERRHVVEAAAQNLRDHYYDPPLAQAAADTLIAQEKTGADNAATQGDALAVLLTGQMRTATHDRHLIVVYSATPFPPAPDPPAALAAYRQAMQQQNCTIRKAAILPHNIGYLKLDSFPDPAICGPQVTAALTSLYTADAIIFDLRDNGGGYPDMVALVAAPLFDRPRPWYNPRQAGPSFTQSPVPGSLLAHKPVYILTSALTLSGAEQFSYNLKMLQRATLVGETTGGAAHAGEFHRIDNRFGMGIPEIRIVNPFAAPDWEGTGVRPDVRVQSTEALARALGLAETRLHANVSTPRDSPAVH